MCWKCWAIRAYMAARHAKWKLEDVAVERAHVALDRADDAYWSLFWKLRGD